LLPVEVLPKIAWMPELAQGAPVAAAPAGFSFVAESFQGFVVS
jgi:hypothetical protein